MNACPWCKTPNDITSVPAGKHSIPNPKIRQVNRYRMDCPDCPWTREFSGGRGREPAERDYETHYAAEHNDLACGSCGKAPEEHGDSVHGPMSVCPPSSGSPELQA